MAIEISSTDNNLLSEELAKIAEKELMEKPSWRDRDIQALREMVIADTQLVARTDDLFLLRFLRARKFDYDRAFKMLHNYYAQRTKFPQIYHELLPSRSKDMLYEGIQGFLPNRDEKGRAIFLYKGGLWNPSRFSFEEVARCNTLCLEMMIQEPDVQVNGIVAIMDMRGLNLQQIKNTGLSNIRQAVSIVQDSFPVRIKAIHVINEPAIFDLLFSLVKPFLGEKIKSRMYFHGTNFQSLHEHLSPHVLPAEYGGHLPAFNNREWADKLIAAEDYFRQDLKYGFVTSRHSERNKELQRTDNLDGFLHSYRRVCIQPTCESSY